MKKKIVSFMACVLLLANVTYTQAQTSRPTHVTAKNAVYLEVGGTSAVYSLSYDRLLNDRTKWKIGARAGVTLLHFSLYDSRLVGEVYALKGHQNHYVELGLGALYRATRQLKQEQLSNGQVVESVITTESPTVGVVPRVGYRFQKHSGGSVFRVGFTPFVEREDRRLKITPWAGISYGISF